MSTIEYERIDNWPKLSFRIDSYFTPYNTYIFRGQADATWKLESTLDREINKLYETPLRRKKAIKEYFEKFRENLRGRTNLDLSSSSEEEIWAIGQHFGLKTPLLDWTRSPYVGLFFSLFGECKSGQRTLWAFLESDLEMLNKTNRKKTDKVKVVNPLSHYNNRLVNQRGLFLYIPNGVEIEDWVKNSKENDWVTMYKFEFPDSIRNDALSALNNMNINHLSLYPDIIGSALYSNYQLESEPYLEKARDACRKAADARERELKKILDSIKLKK